MKRKILEPSTTQPEVKQRTREFKVMATESDLPKYSNNDLYFLVSRLGVDFDDVADRSFLIDSIHSGKPKLAAFALEMGADPNRAIESSDVNDGKTPLSEAIFYAMQAASEEKPQIANEYLQLVKQLLAQGADPNYLPEGLSGGSGARYAVNAVFDFYNPSSRLCQHIGTQLIELLIQNKANFIKLEKRFAKHYQFLSQSLNNSGGVLTSTASRLPGLGGASARRSDYSSLSPASPLQFGTS